MGVTKLASYAKAVASCNVHLSDGRGCDHVIIDGGYLNHRLCTRGVAASQLLLHDDVLHIASEIGKEVRMFEERGYSVTVVFDGTTPPAKQCTSDSRARSREESARQARELHREHPRRCKEINKLASGACVFDSRVNARIAMHLRKKIKGEVYIAPGEADPQIVVFQDIHLNTRTGQVYVYATDSDLLVLGVRQLLYDVRVQDGVMTGRCTKAALLFTPTEWSLSQDTPEHAFLRQLHGLPKDKKDVDHTVIMKPLPEPVARYRLLLYAIVVGNDFASFHNIGPVAAAKLVLTPVQNPTRESTRVTYNEFEATVGGLSERVVVASRQEDNPSTRREAEKKLRKCYTMFNHAVVWNPTRGVLQHASGVSSSEDITIHTGTLELSAVANLIARGNVDARSGQSWDPPLEDIDTRRQQNRNIRRDETAGNRSTETSPRGSGCGPLAGGTRMSASLESLDPASDRGVPLRDVTIRSTNNYASHGFNRLPEEGERFSKWTVAQLREFLSVFRCLDNAGTSGFRKADLVETASEIVRLIRLSGVIGKNMAFRHPIPDERPFKEKERALMPDLPDDRSWIREWVSLRRFIPEISKSVILSFLQEINPLAGEGTRVWYRAEQRALDMGNLSRLWGVPPKDGVMWLGTSAGASFSGDKEYRVRIKLQVEVLDDPLHPTAVEEGKREEGGEGSVGQTMSSIVKYGVALKVVQAICECPAGLGGGCSHVTMVLFLSRLLQMSASELATFNPQTCTGRACAWITQHAKGGRSTDKCDFYGKPLTAGTSVVRSMRDPRGGGYGCDYATLPEEERFVQTRGVTPLDRMHGFNPHPSTGEWAGAKEKFDRGYDMSAKKRAKLTEFVNCEMGEKFHNVCMDYLPPRVRDEDST